VIVFLVIFFSSLASRTIPEKILGIEDKKTAAITCFANDCFLVNLSGVAFSPTAKPSGSLFFLIESENERKDFSLGDTIISRDVLLELLFLRKKIKEDMDINLNIVSSNNFSDFEFKTSEGWVLKLSIENNAPATLEILKRILDEIGSQRFGLEYIDLRISNRVYYKFK